MSIGTLIATTGNGLAVARYANGAWTVEEPPDGHGVRCLAAGPRPRTPAPVTRSGPETRPAGGSSGSAIPSVAYAGTQGRGVLRSLDAGRTWEPAGLDGKIVTALAVSRAEPGVVYAGTKPALVFISRDEGCTWQELEGFRAIRGRWFWFSPAEPPFSAYVQAIGLSPRDPNVIVAGIEAGAVVRSADGGRTWTGHRRGALRDCHTLTFHAVDPTWAYEGGGSGGGAAFSRDGGETWRQPRQGLDRHYGWAVTADPAHPEIWYVSVSTGPLKAHGTGDAQAFIFRAAGGAVWQRLGGGLPQPLAMPYALITDGAAPGHVYAGLSNGDVWHSIDFGDSWQRLPLNLGAIHRAMIAL